MPMLNPFDQSDAFTIVGLTQSVNLIPNEYGRLLRGGLFGDQPIRTTTVIIERQGDSLVLLPSMPRGGSGSQATHGKRNLISLVVPHIPLTDVIRPQDFAGVREFGSEASLKTLASVMTKYLIENKRKFNITWEFLMWGAIKGLIIDGDGETVLEDLFERFKFVPQEFSFELDNPGTDVRAKCRDLRRYMEENLLGDTMTGIHMFVSKEFFDALTGHPNVEKYFLNWAESAQALGRASSKEFVFEGILFEEFGGRAATASGSNIRFIEAGEGHAIPEGTMNTFKTALAPGEFMDTVNTEGEWLYARQAMKDFNRGVDLWFESNPLPYCARPNLLVKCYAD